MARSPNAHVRKRWVLASLLTIGLYVASGALAARADGPMGPNPVTQTPPITSCTVLLGCVEAPPGPDLPDPPNKGYNGQQISIAYNCCNVNYIAIQGYNQNNKWVYQHVWVSPGSGYQQSWYDDYGWWWKGTVYFDTYYYYNGNYSWKARSSCGVPGSTGGSGGGYDWWNCYAAS